MILAPLFLAPVKSVPPASTSEATDSLPIIVVVAAATSVSKLTPLKSKLSGVPVPRTKSPKNALPSRPSMLSTPKSDGPMM